MPEFTIIRPGGVATPGSTPVTIPTVLPSGAVPPPALPDAPGHFTSTNYAATLAETTRTPIYQCVISKPLAGPSAYWTLDEGTGATRVDSVGLNNLTSINTVGQATGHISTAAQFNKASLRYLTCTPKASLLHNQHSFTITARVYMDSKTAYMAICGQYGPNNDQRSYLLYYDQGSDRFGFVINNGSGSQQILLANSFGAPSTGVDYFLEAQYNDEDGMIYISVNNIRDSVARSFVLSDITYAFNVGVQNTTGAYYWDGWIDELRFYKFALSDTERTALYQDRSYTGIPFEVSSAHPSNRDPIGLECLIPITLESRADIEQSRFPLSTLVFALVSDEPGQVRAAVTAGLAGNTIDFYLGFWELEWEANKRLRFHGVITEIEQHAGIYQITARSPMAVANDVQVFDGAQTRLAVAITSTDTTFQVDNTDAFAEPNSDINLTYSMLIENEFVFPRGRTQTAFNSVQRVGANLYAIPPIMANSQAAAHTVGQVVREMVELGQLTGTNSDAGTNDLHPMDHLKNFIEGNKEKASLGSSLVTVNDAELGTAKGTLGAGLKYKFSLDEAINAKAFAEKEIYGTVGGYPRESASGELGIKLYQDAADATIVGTITDKDIIEWPHFLRNAEKIVNLVRVRYDYNPISREFTTDFVYRDETSIGLYGERPLIIESKGIRSEYASTVPVALTWFGDTLDFLLDMCQRQVARFGSKAPVYSFTTVLTKQLLSVGDDLEVSFSQMPDIDTGEISLVNKRVEVQAMRHDFRANLIEFEVMAFPE